MAGHSYKKKRSSSLSRLFTGRGEAGEGICLRVLSDEEEGKEFLRNACSGSDRYYFLCVLWQLRGLEDVFETYSSAVSSMIATIIVEGKKKKKTMFY